MSSTTTPATSADRTSGLQHLLGTCDVATFLRDYIGERMLHVSGARDRWTDLFSWHQLNAVLNEGFIPYPRVRLVKEGVDVDPSLYTHERGQRQWPDSERCHQLMADGATLVLASIDGASTRLEAFVRELERDFAADVRVDVVATCAPVPGLKMHWDNAECFNVQVDGEKRWQVIHPERPYPLTATYRFPQRRDLVKPTTPDGAPTWEGVLTPGDLIYLPRGFWHAVTPHVTPSLHLSFAVDIPTIYDFLQWFAGEAVREVVARRPLPVWETVAARQTRLEDFLAPFVRSLSPDTFEKYLADLAGSAPTRPDFALPIAAARGTAPIGPDTRVRLRSAHPLRWTEEGDSLVFDWRGERYRFDARLIPAMTRVCTMGAFTIDELSTGNNRMLVRAFVLALLNVGLLGFTERTSSHQ